MTLLRLEVTADGTTGVLLADRAEVRRVSAPAAGPWQGLLDAARVLGREPDDTPTSLEIAGGADTLAVWDEETLGSVRPVAFGVAVGAALEGIALAEPHTWTHLREGRYVVGGVASYLVARVTRGVHHVTDPAWADATGLLDAAGRWTDHVLPPEAFPVVTTEAVGTTDPGSFLGLSLPVRVAALR